MAHRMLLSLSRVRDDKQARDAMQTKVSLLHLISSVVGLSFAIGMATATAILGIVVLLQL